MNESDATERRLEGDSEAASLESGIEDVPGTPTWPIQAPGSGQPAPPPVGLNWATVARGLGIAREVLEHEGIIVLAGEYFPESGFFFDPDTLQAQHVDVGDVALRHGYFLGNITARDFGEWYPLTSTSTPASGVSVIHRERGAIIGLFSNQRAAQRAKSAVMQGALGAGVRVEDGPLGSELTVERPELPGAVATAIASHGGAVISIGGRPVRAAAGAGPLATAPAMADAEGDSLRPGTGASSDSQAPSVEIGGSEEFPRL